MVLSNILKLAILNWVASFYVMSVTFGTSLCFLREPWREVGLCIMGKHCPADCSHVTISFPSVPQAQRDIIFELRRIAFDAESDSNTIPGSGTEKRKAMYTKDYKMLGFTVCT